MSAASTLAKVNCISRGLAEHMNEKEILKRYEAPLYENSMDGSLIAPVIRGGVQISVLESSRHELKITQDSKRNLRIRMVL
ncbi:hypothetical protein T10_7836 [Trichinella papuae]|uniref:Uncharacterized protein n=1 Tax=Trichinella papuae TaxID=268474 RepID=A0A0V1M9A8_9BILA|nr:hypothetical protein T10_7836 [Trichinella papuae]